MKESYFDPALLLTKPASFDPQLKASLEVARNRLLVAVLFFIFCLGIIIFRLVELTLLTEAEDALLSRRQMEQGVVTGRADIIDRNGEMLATTITTSSVYANTAKILDVREAADKLAKVLTHVSHDELKKRLSSGKTFIWIARHLTPSQQEQILRLGLPGVSFVRDQRRIYPHGRLAAHVLGFTDVDNRGISGIEKGLEDRLSSSSQPLQLALDVRVQHILRDELLRGMSEFGARGAAGLVVDVRSGEVVAMVSLPDFNPNDPRHATDDERFNKTTLGVYEFGSVLKVANTAMALESGLINLNSRFDATQPLKVGRFTITDFRGRNAWLNVPEVFVYSSNIGAAKMALMVGGEGQRKFLRKLGYLEAPQSELPESGAPLIPSPWTESTIITCSYGYGLSFAPFQLVKGIIAIVRGLQVPLSLVRQAQLPQNLPRVLSAETSRRMLQLMRFVVTHGTAGKANVPGMFVAGKTGTANLRQGRGYQTDRVMTSFVGVLGASPTDPRYAIYTMLDDPKRLASTHGFNTAGWNAAPVGGRVIARMGPVLGIYPKQDYKDTIDPQYQNASFVVEKNAH
ncbi:MAG: peptidoglycan D,D-transpeptidase FtsI family protein [Holosporales bacterium]